MSRRKGSRQRIKAARRRSRAAVAKKGQRDKRTGRPLVRS